MANPEKFNLALAPELIEEFTGIVKRYPRGGKTATITAAMLALIQLPRSEQDALVARVAATRMAGGVAGLVSAAKAKAEEEALLEVKIEDGLPVARRAKPARGQPG